MVEASFYSVLQADDASLWIIHVRPPHFAYFSFPLWKMLRSRSWSVWLLWSVRFALWRNREGRRVCFDPRRLTDECLRPLYQTCYCQRSSQRVCFLIKPPLPSRWHTSRRRHRGVRTRSAQLESTRNWTLEERQRLCETQKLGSLKHGMAETHFCNTLLKAQWEQNTRVEY